MSLIALLGDTTAHARPKKTRVARESRTAEPEVRLGDAAPDNLEWLPSKGRECIRRGRLRGFCQGPRRVPRPHGEAAERAERLEMGGRTPAVKLLYHAPPEAWVRAARELPSERRWAYPVENGKLWRGLGGKGRPGTAKLGGGPRGPRRRPHAGLDIAAPEGTPIRAVQNGIVVYSDNELSGYGNLVIVVHGDGSVALYGHCRATYVFAGQYVSKGVVIGEVGHTGYANGSHLHFEYRVKGRPKDPSKLFDQPLKAAINKRR